ncbi:MAG: BTAD domain-containing putative transcriptional regulator [Caldilineaceae bacterium]
MSQLRLTCFNTFQVTRDAVPITRFHSVKTRALLIYLALEQDAPHPRDVLAGLLWPDHSERRARRNLSQNLMELRRAIGADAASAASEAPDDAAYLHSDTHTIAFNPASSHWVDVLAFETHLATVDEHSLQAHSHAQVFDCPACAEALRQAAALYSGPFLAGFSIDDSDLFEKWLLSRREYYHQRAVETFGRLAAYYEQAGDLKTAQQVVRQLLELAPWQEEAHRQLMRLLARAGQRTQALAQYDRLCRALEDELGVLPSAESNALYDQILAGEITAAASPIEPAAQPSPIAVTAPTSPPFQALAPPPHFVERAAEMQQIQDALIEEHRSILALVGMGGAGKTTLAAHLAHQMRGHFADGVLWANALTSTPLDTLSAWGRAYGYDFGGLADLESRAAAVRSMLADKKALLVVDNVTNAAQVRPLLPGNDGCAVLLTTRDLDVAHAVNAHTAPLGDLPPESALQLLVRVLGEARVAAEEEAAREICAQLHHLPLAVEIVAQRLKSRARLSLTAMAARLRDEQQRLGLEISDQAVRASFRVSWQALDAELQRVYALLAVFEGRAFAVDAAAYLTDLDAFDAEDALYVLVALSLLREEEGGYFRQHPLLADFAQEQLVQTAEAYVRMVNYYGDFAQRNRANYGALEPEWGNIRGAIEAAHHYKADALLIALTASLAGAWMACARYTDARRAYKLTQPALVRTAEQGQQAHFLLRWAEACVEQSAYDEAKQLLRSSYDLYQKAEDAQGVADVEYHLAAIANIQSAFDEADQLIERCLATRLAAKDPAAIAAALYLRASNAYDRDDFDVALENAQQSLDMQSTLEDQRHLSRPLQLLALIYARRDDFARALKDAHAALEVSRTQMQKHEIAASLYTLALVYRYQRDFVSAEKYAKQAFAQFHHFGQLLPQGQLLYQLSIIHKENEAYADAIPLAQDSIALFAQIGDKLGMAYALVHLGDLHFLLGDNQQGPANWRKAQVLGREIESPWVLAETGKRLA